MHFIIPLYSVIVKHLIISVFKDTHCIPTQDSHLVTNKSPYSHTEVPRYYCY